MYQIGKVAWSNIAFSALAGHPVQSVDDEVGFAAKVTNKLAGLGL